MRQGCFSLRWFLLLPFILLTACRSAPPTLKIGLVAPFEGLHRPLGYEALFAVKLALQEQNRQGGIHGYRLELVALNDFDDPAEAAVQARALITDPDVVGVVGHFTPAATLSALPEYRRAGLPAVIPWPVPADALHGQTAVCITATSDELSARLQTLLAGIPPEAVLTIPHPDAFVPPPTPPSAILLTGDGVAAGETLRRLQNAGLNGLPRFAAAEAGSPQLVQVAREAANGLRYVSPGPAPADIEAGDFAQAYQALAGFPPGPRAVLAYDATRVLLSAIAAAVGPSTPPSRAAVAAALPAVQITGLTGPIRFDPRGCRETAPIWIYQIDSGQYPGKLLVYQ